MRRGLLPGPGGAVGEISALHQCPLPHTHPHTQTPPASALMLSPPPAAISGAEVAEQASRHGQGAAAAVKDSVSAGAEAWAKVGAGACAGQRAAGACSCCTLDPVCGCPWVPRPYAGLMHACTQVKEVNASSAGLAAKDPAVTAKLTAAIDAAKKAAEAALNHTGTEVGAGLPCGAPVPTCCSQPH